MRLLFMETEILRREFPEPGKHPKFSRIFPKEVTIRPKIAYNEMGAALRPNQNSTIATKLGGQ